MKIYTMRIMSMTVATVVTALLSITIVRADNQQTSPSLQEFALGSETLEQYAAKCDLATGVTVPDFSCDAGTEVPISHFANGMCDRPNRLNQECDPGSRFQLLANTSDAFVVAHCRKRGLAAGQYADIAVIQYNRNNGAACFYQALGNLNGQVKAPSKGQVAWPWISPAGTAGIRCARCHDNGVLIRSPYITQDMQSNTMPGAGDFSSNKNSLYYWVGEDFASWRAHKVEVTGNLCNSCHRLGVSNLSSMVQGTALDFGIRATAPSEQAKNPHSADSPIWMPPGQITFSQTNADYAKAIHDCALAFVQGGSLPANCTVTPFAWAFLADLLLEQTASPDPVHAGENLTYTLKVTNNQSAGNGPVDVIPASASDPNSPGVTLTDTLPSGVTFLSATSNQGICTELSGVVTCQLGRLNSGASTTVTIVVMVNSSTADGTILTNQADVTSIVPDPELLNNTTQVNTTVITASDLAITKSATTDPVTAGTDEIYQLSITNSGPSDAQTITLAEATPVNTTFVSLTADSGWNCLTPAVGDVGTIACTINTLSSGTSATFLMVVHVSPSAPEGSTLSNTASTSSATIDPDLSNNAMSITTGVIARADLTIALSETNNLVIADIQERYDLSVKNDGPSDAQNVTIIDAIPADTTFISFAQDTGAAFACTTPPGGGTGNINCTIATLTPGESASFGLVVRVSPVDVTSISNTASVSSSITDPNPGNNSATATATVSVKKYKEKVLTDLTTLRDTVSDKKDGKTLDDAIKRLSGSLDAGLWMSENTLVTKNGKNVFLREKDAIVKLSNLIKKNNGSIAGTLQGFINRLVAADHALAAIAIHQAMSATGNPNQILIAQNELARGDQSANNTQYVTAIGHFRNAWQHAQQAMKK
jgi:uncharacterized repeat protein (TIGR01451 family)